MKSILKHYFGLIYQNATGSRLDRDCKREISSAVDDFKKEIKQEIKEEIKQDLRGGNND